LSDPKIDKALSDVNLYKVGHHGSLNATPKGLWALFKNRSANPKAPKRLQSLMSTMPGKHGHADKHTEVPRETLCRAQARERAFFHRSTRRRALLPRHRDQILIALRIPSSVQRRRQKRIAAGTSA
jgi:hypothetical protein